MDIDTVADALDVLTEVPSWELSPQRWDQVGAILDRMDAALTGHHAQELRDAVADLALNGPTRIERIGSKVRTGEPDQVVTRRTTLVHALSKEASDPKDSRGAERRP